ncbi:hypothetical protein IWX81_000773 [Salinibacterium sp. CAN_S4]|uniref:hypothetical protein n=1 Tax=Salinibacterium sp. CAN_S4 TaxID=2787727 RepID=UPI0018EF7DEB
MVISCCVLFWAHSGLESDLSRYIDTVVDLEIEHGGTVKYRGLSDGSDDQPLEVHILEFPNEDMMNNFMGDPRRVEMNPERERVIAKMEIILLTSQPVPEPQAPHLSD